MSHNQRLGLGRLLKHIVWAIFWSFETNLFIQQDPYIYVYDFYNNLGPLLLFLFISALVGIPFLKLNIKEVTRWKLVVNGLLIMITAMMLMQTFKFPNKESRYVLPYLPGLFFILLSICQAVVFRLPVLLRKGVVFLGLSTSS